MPAHFINQRGHLAELDGHRSIAKRALTLRDFIGSADRPGSQVGGRIRMRRHARGDSFDEIRSGSGWASKFQSLLNMNQL